MDNICNILSVDSLDTYDRTEPNYNPNKAYFNLSTYYRYLFYILESISFPSEVTRLSKDSKSKDKYDNLIASYKVVIYETINYLNGLGIYVAELQDLVHKTDQVFNLYTTKPGDRKLLFKKGYEVFRILNLISLSLFLYKENS